MRIVVVVPTYNESNNITQLAETVLGLGIDGLGLLIVDDDSPDGTGRIADELARQYPTRVEVLHRRGKLGLGTAYVQGFQWALQHGADFIIQMDADFSHSPAYLVTFLELIPQCDVVVGSRYVPGGALDRHWSWWRSFLSWWANSVWVRLILGVRTHDATAGFKCWRRSALERINLDQVRSNGYIFQVELCYLAEQNGLRILETPIYFEDRRAGQSKLSVRVKLEAAIRVLEMRWRARPRPSQSAISNPAPRA